MQPVVNEATLLGIFYNAEVALSNLFAHFHYQYAPVFVGGDIADPKFYNIPYLHPVTTESVSYLAAGAPVHDTYSGVTLWNLLNTADGGVDTTTAKNDILS